MPKAYRLKILSSVLFFFYFLALATLLANKSVQAEKLADGTWAQSASPGTTTITFTNGSTLLTSSSDIVLTFPSTATLNQSGSNISVTGQGTVVRVNDTLDRTITLTIDGTISASLAVTITMTDALSAYTTTTYAQESVAINTLTITDEPVDFGIALKTNDNTTTVTTSVPLFVNFAIDDTAIDLGTLSTASINEVDQTYTINTNNQTGITMQIVADGTLNDASSNTINAVSDGTVTAGSEEYGISVDNVSGVTIEAPFDSGDDEIPTVAADIASSSSPLSNATFDINYKASITGTTVSGEYDQVVTVTIATNA